MHWKKLFFKSTYLWAALEMEFSLVVVLTYSDTLGLVLTRYLCRSDSLMMLYFQGLTGLEVEALDIVD